MPTPEHRNVPVVVTKRPRSEWRIPRIDAEARLRRTQQKESPDKTRLKFTTPEAREILRKILYRIEQQIRNGTHTLAQLINDVDADLNTFAFLQPEFAILLSYYWRTDEEILRNVSIRNFSTMVVLRMNVAVEVASIKANAASAKKERGSRALPPSSTN